MTVVCRASSLGTVTNVAIVSQDQTDPSPTDNLATSSTTIIPQPSVSINNVLFAVSLSAPSRESVSVDYWTVDGTARAGRDYGFKSGTLIFQPGIMNKLLSIAVYGNTLNEVDKKFWLVLANSINATHNADEAVGTIINDDLPPPFAITSLKWIDTELRIYRLFKSRGFSTNSTGAWQHMHGPGATVLIAQMLQ